MAKIFKFGVFTLDSARAELAKSGTPVKLQDQSLQMLLLLLERRHEVVTREELRSRLWPDTFVDFDVALNTTVRKIRRVLGESAEQPLYIETLPKRGYRFIAPVEELGGGPAPRVVAAESAVPQPVPPGPNAASGATGRRQLLLIGGIASVLAISIGTRITLSNRSHNRGPSADLDQIGSVAVLPFEIAGNGDDLDYLGDGLAESLTDGLSGIPSLRIMTPGTMATFKGREVDPRTVGRQLGVAAVVQGRVARRGDTLIVDVNLAKVSDGVEIWRGRYRRQTGEALDLEQEISRDLTRRLRPASTINDHASGARRSTRNKSAYEHYLRGIFLMRQLAGDKARQAIEQFEKAVAEDASYALPYVGLSWTYQVQDDWVRPPREVLPKAREAAQKALDLDPQLAEAHTQMATIHFWYDYDQPGAEREFQRSIELNPNLDDTHCFYGWYLVCHRRFDEGFAEHRRALELSPLDYNDHVILAMSLYYAGRYQEAKEELGAILAQNPNVWLAHELLGWVYETSGDLSNALAEMKKALDLEHTIAEPLASLGRVLALQGDRRGALNVIEELRKRPDQGHVPPYTIAYCYTALGEKEKAIQELEKAYHERSFLLTFLGLDPKLASVANDPRVVELLKRVGVP